MNLATKARACAPPSDGGLATCLPGADYVDAFEAPLNRVDASITELYAGVFMWPPRVVVAMMRLRNLLVAPFGLKAGAVRNRNAFDARRRYAVGDEIGMWRLFGIEADEIIAGADDSHLDFRVSLQRRDEPAGPSIILATAVKTHNLLGRAYLRVILPFHRLIVRTMLDDALKARRV